MSPRPPWQPGKAWLYTWLYSHWQLGPSSGLGRSSRRPLELGFGIPRFGRRPWVKSSVADFPDTGGRALPVTASARSPQLGSSGIWYPRSLNPPRQLAHALIHAAAGQGPATGRPHQTRDSHSWLQRGAAHAGLAVKSYCSYRHTSLRITAWNACRNKTPADGAALPEDIP